MRGVTSLKNAREEGGGVAGSRGTRKCRTYLVRCWFVGKEWQIVVRFVEGKACVKMLLFLSVAQSILLIRFLMARKTIYGNRYNSIPRKWPIGNV